MKILAIDTSGANCGVAIIEDENVLANFVINNGITHSQNLLPMIEQAQKFAGIDDLSEIDAFACSIGPGSFTGLRIGIATIKGFALSLNKPTISVPTLLSLTYNVPNFEGIVCSILDAKNNNVYAGIYRSEKDEFPVLQEDYISDDINVLLDKLKDYDDSILFVGDGATFYHDMLLENLESDSRDISFVPVHLSNQSPLSVAYAALDMAKQNEFTDYNSLSPLYLKKSQAERELEAKKD